jgi:hypothetical protein
VQNRQNFLGTDALRLTWTLYADDTVIDSGSTALPALDPGATADMSVPWDAAVRPGAVLWAHLSVSTIGATDAVPAGHEVAAASWRREPLIWPSTPARSLSILGLEQSPHALTIRAQGATWIWNPLTAQLIQVEMHGRRWLKAPARLSLWRAPTDNDVRQRRSWEAFGLHELLPRVVAVAVGLAPDGHEATVRTHFRLGAPARSWGLDVQVLWAARADGTLRVSTHLTPDAGGPPTLPRVGWTLPLMVADHAKWFGRGPGESYPDSWAQAPIGLYESSVDRIETPYVRPQENGNHVDVDWVAVTDARGWGLLAAAEDRLQFSVSRHATDVLTRTSHRHLLPPEPGAWWHLDHAQHGLGSASCGPDTLAATSLQTRPFAWTWTLEPFDANRDSGFERWRQNHRQEPKTAPVT